MAPVNLTTLQTVSEALDKLNVKYAFTGGIIVGFLLDDPNLVRLRITDDVDAIANVMTLSQMASLEKQMRLIGFRNDITEDAPICRWIYQGSKVDVMPVKDHTGTLHNEWFGYALKTASVKTLHHVSVQTISATAFIATKLSAFLDRGAGDFSASHDLEDIITVINGREQIVNDLESEEPDLRAFVSNGIHDMLGRQRFVDAIPYYLETDVASQGRLPWLIQRLKEIGDL